MRRTLAMLAAQVSLQNLAASQAPVVIDLPTPQPTKPKLGKAQRKAEKRARMAERRAIVGVNATPLDEIPDAELPGMWERADFTGGQDEVRDSAGAGVQASAVPLTETQREGLTVKRDVNIGGAAVLRLCASTRDGDCDHPHCPQLRDGEPAKTGRHCPLDLNGGDDE